MAGALDYMKAHKFKDIEEVDAFINEMSDKLDDQYSQDKITDDQYIAFYNDLKNARVEYNKILTQRAVKREMYKQRKEVEEKEFKHQQEKIEFNSNSHRIHKETSGIGFSDYDSDDYKNTQKSISDYYKDLESKHENEEKEYSDIWIRAEEERNREIARNRAREDKDIKLQRIREDNSFGVSTKVLNAFGIPMPEGLISNARKYDRAIEDKQRVYDRAVDANNLTNEEQKQVDALDEIIEKTKPANELLQKFGLNTEQASNIIKIATPAIAVFTTIIVTLNKAIQLITKHGKELIDTYNANQRALAVYGRVLNKQKDSLAELQGEVETNSKNIRSNFNETFNNLYAGILTIRQSFQNMILWFQENDIGKKVGGTIRKALIDGIESVPIIGLLAHNFNDISEIGALTKEESNKSNRKDEYFDGLIKNLTKANPDLAKRIGYNEFVQMAGRQLTNISDNNDDLRATEYQLNAIYRAATNSFLWDNYNNNSDDIKEFLNSLSDATEKGTNLSQYGLTTDDNALVGYMYSMGLNPVIDYYSDSELDAIRTRYLMEQLNSKNADALREQNRLYQEQGELINACRDSLMSYDEVNILSGKDTSILGLEEMTSVLEGDAEDIQNTMERAARNSGEAFKSEMNKAMQSTLDIAKNVANQIQEQYKFINNHNTQNQFIKPIINGSYKYKADSSYIPSFDIIDTSNLRKAESMNNKENRGNLYLMKESNNSGFNFGHNTNKGNVYNLTVNGAMFTKDSEAAREYGRILFDAVEQDNLRGGH